VSKDYILPIASVASVVVESENRGPTIQTKHNIKDQLKRNFFYKESSIINYENKNKRNKCVNKIDSNSNNYLK